MIGLPVTSKQDDESNASETPLRTVVDNFDWSETPLGPMSHWSPTLVALVDVVIASKQPMCLAWGSDQIWIYNDAFVPILGSIHPANGRAAGLKRLRAF